MSFLVPPKTSGTSRGHTGGPAPAPQKTTTEQVLHPESGQLKGAPPTVSRPFLPQLTSSVCPQPTILQTPHSERNVASYASYLPPMLFISGEAILQFREDLIRSDQVNTNVWLMPGSKPPWGGGGRPWHLEICSGRGWKDLRLRAPPRGPLCAEPSVGSCPGGGWGLWPVRSPRLTSAQAKPRQVQAQV